MEFDLGLHCLHRHVCPNTYGIYSMLFAFFSPHYATEDDALNARRLKKSVTLYTTFDWSKVPRLEERRQAEHVFDSPEIITHVYR